MLPRPIPQMQVDALVTVFEHFTACEHTDTPLPGATVIVRVNLDDLQNDTGFGTIDGIDQPISISTVRRMAADGGIIPCVLGRDSDILDWGRRQRLFTTAQRLALVERDGGCIGCGAPPGRSKAHHIRWWSNGGTTDLDNGCLLCDNCHHRIHDNGWDIRIDGTGTDAKVWLIPPVWIDATQTPRPAARIRHTDFLA
jgi:5-methylcytosine-specific restriction protein A